MFKLLLQMCTNEITIVGTSLEWVGRCNTSRWRYWGNVTPVPPRENGFSRVWGGVQMFKLLLQMSTNEITIDGIFLTCIYTLVVLG